MSIRLPADQDWKFGEEEWDSYFERLIKYERCVLIDHGAVVLADYQSPFGVDQKYWWYPNHRFHYVDDMVCIPRQLHGVDFRVEWWFVPHNPNLVISSYVPTKGNNWKPWGDPHFTTLEGEKAHSGIESSVFSNQQDAMSAIALLCGAIDEHHWQNSNLARFGIKVLQR